MTRTAVAVGNEAPAPTKEMKYRATIGRSDSETKTAKVTVFLQQGHRVQGDGPVPRPGSSSPGTRRSPLRSRCAAEPASGGGRGTAGATRRPNLDDGPRSIARSGFAMRRSGACGGNTASQRSRFRGATPRPCFACADARAELRTHRSHVRCCLRSGRTWCRLLRARTRASTSK